MRSLLPRVARLVPVLLVLAPLPLAQRQAQAHSTPSVGDLDPLAPYLFEELASGIWLGRNPQQGLNFRVSLDGLEVSPRGSLAAGMIWSMRFTTVAFGRGGALAGTLPQAVTASEFRAEIAYESGLLEWFENAPLGLKQGWTVPQRIPGNGELRLEIACAGDLAEIWEPGFEHCTLVDENGRRCATYGSLKVFDATGAPLTARFEPRRTYARAINARALEGLAIVIDDTDALYPLTVDPILNGPVWRALGDQVGERFGFALGTADVDGDGLRDLILGSPRHDDAYLDAGAAYVYRGQPNGLSNTPVWSTFGAGAGAQFGYAVSSAGDVNGDGFEDVLIGAAGDVSGLSAAGEAFLFLGSSTGLSTTPAWTWTGTRACEVVGASVGAVGDVNGDGFDDFAVGASGENGALKLAGAVHVFFGTNGTLPTTPSWSRLGEEADARFGNALERAGDINSDGFDDFLAAASRHGADSGRVYLFSGSPSGPTGPTWTFDGDPGDRIGHSLASNGDVNGDGLLDVALGGNRVGAGSERALIFYGSGGSLAPTPDFELAVLNDLGAQVAFVGDLNRDGIDDVALDEFVHRGSPAGVEVKPAAFAAIGNSPQPSPAQHQGTAAAIAGIGDLDQDGHSDVVFASSETFGRGAASLYAGGADPFTFFPQRTPTEISDPDLFQLGESLAAADLDGDGYGDVVAGLPSGRAVALSGGPTGLQSTPSWDKDFPNRTGTNVAVADWNSDGAPDVVVSLSGSLSSRVAYFPGSSNGPGTAATWRRTTLGTDLPFVAVAGDVDADGFLDLLVGSGVTPSRRVDLYRGGALGPASAASWTYGVGRLMSVSGVGDCNGDGFADVVIANGRLEGFLGSAAGLPSVPSQLFTSSSAEIVSGVGDVDGDGFDDFVFGRPGLIRGGITLHRGEPNGWSAQGQPIVGGRPQGNFGSACALLGDINGDGRSDVLIGDDLPSNPAAYLLRGRSVGLSRQDWSFLGTQPASDFGRAVVASDVNGDGVPDAIFGAPRFDTPTQVDQGALFVFEGNPLLQWANREQPHLGGCGESSGASRFLLLPPKTWRASIALCVRPAFPTPPVLS